MHTRQSPCCTHLPHGPCSTLERPEPEVERADARTRTGDPFITRDEAAGANRREPAFLAGIGARADRSLSRYAVWYLTQDLTHVGDAKPLLLTVADGRVPETNAARECGDHRR